MHSSSVTISFPEHAMPGLEIFLQAWEQAGAWQAISGGRFQLHSFAGSELLLLRQGSEMHFTGQFAEDALECLRDFARQWRGDLREEKWLGSGDLVGSTVIEGEFIGADEAHEQPGARAGAGEAPFGRFASGFPIFKLKTKHKLLGLAVLLVLLPIALVLLLLFIASFLIRWLIFAIRMKLRV